MNLVQTLPVGILLTAFAAAGCATAAPPQELLTARTAYDRASHGPAAQLSAADLHTAKSTLDTAEQSFAKNDDPQETSALAYTATRSAELAEVRARIVQNTEKKKETVANQQLVATSNAQLTSAELVRAKTQIAMDGQKLQQAAADLAKYAAVKQEPRGMVITLSGSVLFASAKSDLLPSAQQRLAAVADTLTKQDPDAKLVVEGHTDSQGGTSYNQELSQRRAESVRSYLVSHGIASDRVTAQGFGSSRSVADNGSTEGRANNRRVEIVVQPNQPSQAK